MHRTLKPCHEYPAVSDEYGRITLCWRCRNANVIHDYNRARSSNRVACQTQLFWERTFTALSHIRYFPLSMSYAQPVAAYCFGFRRYGSHIFIASDQFSTHAYSIWTFCRGIDIDWILVVRESHRMTFGVLESVTFVMMRKSSSTKIQPVAIRFPIQKAGKSDGHFPWAEFHPNTIYPYLIYEFTPVAIWLLSQTQQLFHSTITLRRVWLSSSFYASEHQTRTHIWCISKLWWCFIYRFW